MHTFGLNFENVKLPYTHYYDKSCMLHCSLTNIMGTGLDILIINKYKEFALSVWDSIFAEIQRLHTMFNRFDAASELSAINRLAGRQAVSLSDEWWNVLCDVRQYHRLTYGYFDVSLHDFNNVVLEESTHTLRFVNPDVFIDLGGYAKGYTLEKIRRILVQHDIRQALVNLGNSAVFALGAHPHGEAWQIGVNHPFEPDKVLKTYSLQDSSLSTSGNSPKNPAHIINPHTGKFCADRKMVTVVSKECIDAEVLTTALMIADEYVTKQIGQSFKDISINTFELH